MMNGKEYIDSLRDLNPEVYFFGQRIKNIADEPMFQPHIHTAAMTYDLAHDPEYQEIMTATSHLTGERINRFTHIHQSIDDLVKKVRMMRLLGQKTGTCFQRCVGLDGLNVDRSLGSQPAQVALSTPVGVGLRVEDVDG